MQRFLAFVDSDFGMRAMIVLAGVVALLTGLVLRHFFNTEPTFGLIWYISLPFAFFINVIGQGSIERTRRAWKASLAVLSVTLPLFLISIPVGSLLEGLTIGYLEPEDPRFGSVALLIVEPTGVLAFTSLACLTFTGTLLLIKKSR